MSRQLQALLRAFMIFTVAVAAGCGDGPTEHEEEIHVHGVVISDGGTPVVTVDEDVVMGAIAVDAGDETPDYTFVFMDHDGDPIAAGDLSGFAVEATVDDTGVAIFHSTADFEAHFQGISAGATTVVIHLTHAADGDSHFDSPDIDITVN